MLLFLRVACILIVSLWFHCPLQLDVDGVAVTAASLHPSVSLHSSPDLQNLHYFSLLIFLKQTLPRLYCVCDVNKRPLGTQMRMLSFSLLLNESMIWLTFLVTAYYKIQPVEFSFHSTYLLVAKSSISHGKHLLCLCFWSWCRIKFILPAKKHLIEKRADK